ncbi:MAG: DUF92 domain-containing protein [Anaerolineales bacterium]|nr:DUF92 domain-containing protein [Anaerolineales bacterium]
MTTQLLFGTFLGVLVGYAAWRFHALNRSGAWAAGIVGALVFGLGGLPWAMLLLTFFISSSALSRAFARRKAALSEKFSKGSQRDWGQVLANGGLGAFLAIIYAFFPESIWPWIAFSGAMAAVNADTWATELGVFSSTLPRLITNGRPVERGTSGGVTFLGYLAALGGALLVGLVAVPFTTTTVAFALLGIVALAGLSGSTFDSFLGATVQAIYYCPQCQKETERHPVHTCGTGTTRLRGWRWLNNDMVNFACSLVGAIVAIGLWRLMV